MSTRPPRRSGPSTGGVAGRTVIVVVLAGVLGWLILRNGFKSSDSTANGATSHATTTARGATTTTSSTLATTTTTTLPSMVGVKIIVLNGSGVGGAAGKLTQGLQKKTLGGATLAPAKDATNPNFATSAVYYAPTFQGQAQLVADLITPGIVVSPLPATSPAKTPSDLTGMSVVALIGKDIGADVVAGKIPAADPNAPATSSVTTGIPGGTVASTAKPATTTTTAKKTTTTTTVKKVTTTSTTKKP